MRLMTWRALSTSPYSAAGVDVAKVVTFGAPKLGPKETREAAEAGGSLRTSTQPTLNLLLLRLLRVSA